MSEKNRHPHNMVRQRMEEGEGSVASAGGWERSALEGLRIVGDAATEQELLREQLLVARVQLAERVAASNREWKDRLADAEIVSSRRVLEAESRYAEVERKLSQRHAEIATLTRMLRERNSELEAAVATVALRDFAVDELQIALAEVRQQLDIQTQAAVEQTANAVLLARRCHEIETSTSWRLTAPLRAIVSLLKR